jgi:hypothetical protein
MTWAEICERYADEWVVLVETEWVDEDNFEFDRSVVLCHSKSHKELYREARPLLRGVIDAGIYFTGPMGAPVPRST